MKYNQHEREESAAGIAAVVTHLTLSVVKANLTKPRKRLNPETVQRNLKV